MKTDFILYKINSNKPIIVNEKSNSTLLKRCQDNWYHKKDIRYSTNKSWFSKMGFTSSKSKTNQADYLFIHIPKTGGISFKFNVIYNPHLTKKIAIYHKFNYPPKNIPELDIFNETIKMFTLIREPSKTIISAYYHFNHFLNMSLIDFCNKYKNIQIKFLLGYDICSSYEVTNEDLKNIKKLIDEKKLIVGIHKTKKMLDIYNLLGIENNQVDNYILNKKVGVKYKLSDISNDLRNHIKAKNKYDNMLYKYVLEI